jgi:sugar lactone lactonase YvrE
MSLDKHVGRVGALAVALGIGSAIAMLPGQAWAESGTPGPAATSEKSAGSPKRPTSSADTDSTPRKQRAGGSDIDASATDARDDTDLPAQKPGSTRAAAKDTENGDAQGEKSARQSRRESRAVTEADTGAAASTPTKSRSGKVTTDSPAPVDATPAPPESDSAVVEAAKPPAQKEQPAAEASAEAPVPTLATVVRSLFSPKPAAESGDAPDSPGASPLWWTLAAYARRQASEATIDDRGTAASTSQTTAQNAEVLANSATASIPGDTTSSPVIGADGTVFQVTRDSTSNNRTRVTILDSTGQILATSKDIRGSVSSVAARPDGTLIVVTSRFLDSTVSSVDAEGKVTRVATVFGQPLNDLEVGADGALYFRTVLPNIFAMFTGGVVGHRTYRVSPQNWARSFTFDTDLALAPDGTAYLVSSQYGFSTFRVIPSNGFSRARSLPFGVDPGAPILAQDGTGHVTVGITPSGGQQTRLYTSTGSAISMRTITGSPGGTVVGADGVYLETFTDAGTTYISRITATGVNTSDAIGGRVAEFQVTEDGTVYAAIDDPDATEASVAVVDRDGTVRTVALPGTLVVRPRTIRDGGTQNAEDVGYVNYTAAGREYVAVLGPDGTVQRTIELPEGATGGSVFFGPDGTAYEVLDYRNAQGQIISRQILTLATTTYTANVAGTRYNGTRDDVLFGPNGIGYLLTATPTGLPGNPVDLDVLGFNAAGETVARASGLTNPETTYTNNPDRAVLAFDRDGTAYVTIDDTEDAPGVYAVTATGAQKVADIEYGPFIQGYPAVFGLDGTGYVTAGPLFSASSNATTVVTVFSPLSLP